MKKILSNIFGLLILFILFNIILRIQSSNFKEYVTPLPYFFSNFIEGTLGASTTLWKPKLEENKDMEKLDLTASSAISYDVSNDKLIFQKNINDSVPIASLTKILTALVALEHEKLDREITITKSMLVGENSMGLEEGEAIKLEQLLYGLMLPSGNDAAEAIAVGSSIGRENFIFLMNKKAEDMGLSKTHFTNPTGLEGDGNQYSTASDLLVMTRIALSNPIFAKIVSTYEYHIPQSDTHKEFTIYNDTNLLTSYPGVKGVKTGFTNEAGYCLVTYVDYEGHKIIAVILNSENRRQEMKDLLDYSLRDLGIVPPQHL